MCFMCLNLNVFKNLNVCFGQPRGHDDCSGTVQFQGGGGMMELFRNARYGGTFGGSFS